MVTQTTTLEAWMSIEHSLNERQEIVKEALEYLGAGTNNDIATHLDCGINRVTPRVLELRKEGIITCTSNNLHLSDIPDCPCHVIQNGRRAITWHVIKKRW